MFKLILIMTALICLTTVSNAEDDFRLVGMASLAFNSRNSFISFGGPGLKIESTNYSAGASFFPSLRHNRSTDEWSPILGIGVFAGGKNAFLTLPAYYYSSVWYGAIGLGYKF